MVRELLRSDERPRPLTVAERQPLIAAARSGPRVAGAVRAAQPRRFNAGVNLCTREVLVAEQLLNGAKIGAAVKQMRSERVAQRVRVHPPWKLGGAGPEPQPPAHI